MRQEIEYYIASISQAQAYTDYVYPADISRDDFIALRLQQLEEVRQMIRRNDRFLADFFTPLENKERLTEEDKAELEDFANALNTGLSASDDGILLRLYTILYHDAMQGENLNDQVKYVYYRAYYEYAVKRMSALFVQYRGFEEIREYVDMYDLLTTEGKRFFMRCWCNQLLLMGYDWRQKKEIVDLVREKRQEEPDNGLPYDRYFLTMYRNIKNLFNEKMNNDRTQSPTDPGVISLSCEASDYVYEHMMHMKNNPRANRTNALLSYYVGQFYKEQLTLDELIKQLTALEEIRDDYNLMEKSTIHFKVSMAIPQFKRLYDKSTTANEIYNLFRAGLDDAVAFMHELKPSEINSSIALEYCSYLEKMVEFLSYDQVQSYYEEALRVRSKALYVHAVTVARLCVSISHRLLRTQPDYFVGITGCDTLEQVREKESNILNMAYNIGFFHDIGMTRQMDLRSIRHRSLSPMEKEILMSHPLTGIFKLSSNYPPVLKECIRTHHIAFDGSGYPEGVTLGRDAPLIHILYFANALENATNPFFLHDGDTVTVAEFMAEARANAGKTYSPQVVDAADKDAEANNEILSLLGEQRTDLIWKVYTE